MKCIIDICSSERVNMFQCFFYTENPWKRIKIIKSWSRIYRKINSIYCNWIIVRNLCGYQTYINSFIISCLFNILFFMKRKKIWVRWFHFKKMFTNRLLIRLEKIFRNYYTTFQFYTSHFHKRRKISVKQFEHKNIWKAIQTWCNTKKYSKTRVIILFNWIKIKKYSK